MKRFLYYHEEVVSGGKISCHVSLGPGTINTDPTPANRTPAKRCNCKCIASWSISLPHKWQGFLRVPWQSKVTSAVAVEMARLKNPCNLRGCECTVNGLYYCIHPQFSTNLWTRSLKEFCGVELVAVLTRKFCNLLSWPWKKNKMHGG